jgi:hypothetical protein
LTLVTENLDEATVERAATLAAREQAAARQVRLELPAAFESAGVCAAALERLSGSGHHGLVATQDGRAAAVMTAAVRENLLPAGMLACRPKASPSTRTSPIRLGSSPRPSGISRRR